MLLVKNKLIFNNTHVGYRVQSKWDDFDVSNDDLQLIQEDFNGDISYANHVDDIILVEKGNLLVPSNAENVKEMTYATFAQLRGVDRLSKTDTQLKKLYNYYNKLCFNNELPQKVAVEWSSRMTSGAGYCRRTGRKGAGTYFFLIKLSTHYHNRFPDEVVDTLVHEMIHVYHPGDHHGPQFKGTMHRINSEFGMNLTIHATGRALVKYTYACVDCGYEYERAKRININRATCGVRGCGGRLYLQEDHTEDMFDDTDWGEW